MKPKILVVDDMKENVDMLNQYFQMKGFQTVLAYGGKEAIEKAEQEAPDLILLDVIMPDVDGFQVCETLKKKRTHFKDIPIVLVTARDDLDSKIRGLEMGADDYVTKPFEIRELEARVNSAVRLKKAHDELKELNEMKNQFLGIASHDLKGPIARIEQAAELILNNRGDLKPEQLRQLERIKKEARDIFSLISDLLNIVKIDAGKLGLDTKEVDFEILIDELLRMNFMAAESKKLKIETVMEANIPKIIADPMRLLEVLENLLSNAMKFSHPGGVIAVGLKKVENSLELTVVDQGVGIPEAELSHVFDRFVKLSPKPTGGEKGTGLGLSICKQIVELHKGKISLKSKIGKGTTVTIFLPV
jgi:signal transduction histidine kinase